MLSRQYQQLSYNYVLYSAVLHSQTPQYTVVFYSGVIIDIFKTENQFSESLRGSLCLCLYIGTIRHANILVIYCTYETIPCSVNQNSTANT
jgi:hypothetical protein